MARHASRAIYVLGKLFLRKDDTIIANADDAVTRLLLFKNAAGDWQPRVGLERALPAFQQSVQPY